MRSKSITIEFSDDANVGSTIQYIRGLEKVNKVTINDPDYAYGYWKVLDSSPTLEAVLSGTMDWILKHIGYCNIAIWLNGEDELTFDLGAYMKYKIKGDDAFTVKLRDETVLETISSPTGYIHVCKKLNIEDVEKQLFILSSNSTYCGKSLAVITIFDEKEKFTDKQVEILQTIASILPYKLEELFNLSETNDEQ